MGVTISTHSDVSPLALASTTAGFISFAFTIATFLRVTWENYATFRYAHRQIETHLGNLKQGLYEERAHLRRARDRQRRQRQRRNSCEASLKEAGVAEQGYASYYRYHGSDAKTGVRLCGDGGSGDGGGPVTVSRYQPGDGGCNGDDDVTARVMRATVRNMLREFRELERPFLRDEDDGGEEHTKGSSRLRNASSARNGEKGREQEDRTALSDEDEDADDSDDEECAYRTVYRECGLRERFLWLRRKADVVLLLQRLGRLETRRIAKEVGEAALIVRNVRDGLEDLDIRIWSLEQHLSRSTTREPVSASARA